MDLLFSLLLAISGIFFCFLAYKAQRRNWKGVTMMYAFGGLIAILCAQPWVAGFLKSHVWSLAITYGEQLNSFHETITEVEGVVRKHQEKLHAQQQTIEAHQEDLTKVQNSVLETHKKFTKNADLASEAIEKAKREIAASKVELERQNQEIIDVQVLVRGLFSEMVTEGFVEPDSQRYFIVKEPNIKREGTTAVLVFELEHVPIKSSVRLQYHVYAQPPGSYLVSQNLILFFWGENPDHVTKKPFYVEYVPDSSAEAMKVDVLSINNELRAKTAQDKPIELFVIPRTSDSKSG